MLVALIGACLALVLAGRFLPGPLAWGFNHLHYLPWWFAVLWVAAAAALLLPAVRRGLAGFLSTTFPRLLFESRLAALLFPLSALAFFWLLRERSFFMGDGYLVGELVDRGMRFRAFDSLDYLLHFQIFQALRRSGSTLTSFDIYQIGSVLAGGMAVALLPRLLRRLDWEPWRRSFVFVLFFCSGAGVLFFGYVESYTWLFVFLCGFLISAVAALQGRAPVWLAGLFWGLALSFHLTALFSVGALFYLAWTGPAEGRKRRWVEALLPPLALFALAVALHIAEGYNMTWFRREFIESKNSRSILIPWTQGRGLLTFYHWKDLFNLALITAPIALALALARHKVVWQRHREPVIRLLLIQIASVALFSLIIDRKLGGARDWDLLVAHLPGLVLLAAQLLPGMPAEDAPPAPAPGRPARKGRKASPSSADPRIAWVGAGALLMTAPLVLLLHLEERSIERFVSVAADFPPFQRAYAYEEVGKYYRKAATAGLPEQVGSYRKPEMEQAEHMYERCVATYPGNPRFRVLLGSIYFMQGKYREAEEQYRSAFESDPRNAMAVEMLGKVAIQDGDQKAATEWFGRLVELTPNKLQSWELLAGAAIQASDVNAGAKAFRRIMELDPSRNHWADMGALLLQEQRWGEAAEALGKAVQRGGASARVRLAWMYARLAEAGSRGGSVPAGLLEEAEAEVRKALEADQGDRQAQELLRLVREIRRG